MSDLSKRVVCAALSNKDGKIVTGARHYDWIMISQINSSKDDWSDHETIIQGFIDQRCNFLTREEAWKLAKENGQIVRLVGGQDDEEHGVLYSENLY